VKRDKKRAAEILRLIFLWSLKGEFHATWVGVDGAQGAETLSYLHAVGFSCMLISCITTQHLQ
jgi:hypothetical protein